MNGSGSLAEGRRRGAAAFFLGRARFDRQHICYQAHPRHFWRQIATENELTRQDYKRLTPSPRSGRDRLAMPTTSIAIGMSAVMFRYNRLCAVGVLHGRLMLVRSVDSHTTVRTAAGSLWKRLPEG